MTLSTYLLYVAAVALLILTPGPTMLMCMTNALNHGPRRAMTSVAGAVTAVLGVMVLSAMGLGALLAASETAFTAVKVAGAAYLIWLGIKTFRSNTALHLDAAVAPGRSFYLQGLLVGASNPKAVLFFAAFFPQFLNPAAPMVPQLAVLALTFMAFEFTVLTLCALGVSRLVPLLKTSGPVKWINRICGGLFTVMGGLLLLTRRQA
jgi:threonine/homoserine/homoserine lactone efflux protein